MRRVFIYAIFESSKATSRNLPKGAKSVKMKIQHTNQTMIDSIASDNAWAVRDLINSGMSIDEACEAQVDSAMDERFDDEQYDAPYDRQQLFLAYKNAVIE